MEWEVTLTNVRGIANHRLEYGPGGEEATVKGFEKHWGIGLFSNIEIILYTLP